MRAACATQEHLHCEMQLHNVKFIKARRQLHTFLSCQRLSHETGGSQRAAFQVKPLTRLGESRSALSMLRRNRQDKSDHNAIGDNAPHPYGSTATMHPRICSE